MNSFNIFIKIREVSDEALSTIYASFDACLTGQLASEASIPKKFFLVTFSNGIFI